jgi:hypothetical protein
MATRRLGNAVCDHGAQFFTVRTSGFGDIVSTAGNAGAIVPWCTGFPRPAGDTVPTESAGDGHPRWRGVRGMTDLAKWVTGGLPRSCSLRTGCKVVAVRMSDRQAVVDVEVEGAGVESLTTRTVVLSPPVPQSLDLLAAGGLLGDERAGVSGAPLDDGAIRLLRTVDYDPCFALMLVLAAASRVPPPGAMQFAPDAPGPIAWLADNHQKGISPVPALTVHATGRFSREHFDRPPDEVVALLLEHLQPWIDGDLPGAVLERSLHRWKFALPTNPVPEPLVSVSSTPPIVCCGDAFAGPRVEGAASSGLAAGRWVIEALAAG